MDLVRLNTLTRYWTQHPALHQMIQDFLGIKGSKPGDAPAGGGNTSADLDEFISMFSGAGGMTH